MYLLLLKLLHILICLIKQIHSIVKYNYLLCACWRECFELSESRWYFQDLDHPPLWLTLCTEIHMLYSLFQTCPARKMYSRKQRWIQPQNEFTRIARGTGYVSKKSTFLCCITILKNHCYVDYLKKLVCKLKVNLESPIGNIVGLLLSK